MIKGGQGREPEDIEGAAVVVAWVVMAAIGWLAVYGLWRLLTS